MKYCSAVDLTRELKPSKEVRYEARKAEMNGLEVFEVPFSEFKDFYTSIVSVKKSEETWNELSKMFFAFLAKKDDIPVSGAAFMSYEKQVYYSMAVTDFASPHSEGAGYFLQTEVMKVLKRGEYELYVIGLLAEEGDSQKLQDISSFKEKLGNLYQVEGEKFPFTSYVSVKGKML